jgi:hypothetical protein
MKIPQTLSFIIGTFLYLWLHAIILLDHSLLTLVLTKARKIPMILSDFILPYKTTY